MKKNRILTLVLCLLLAMSAVLLSTKSQVAKADSSPQGYYSILDDYYLLNKNQGRMGLCWNFTGTRALETLYAKYLNEYISFAEAGFPFRTKKSVGTGAQGRLHWYALGEEDADDKIWNRKRVFL